MLLEVALAAHGDDVGSRLLSLTLVTTQAQQALGLDEISIGKTEEGYVVVVDGRIAAVAGCLNLVFLQTRALHASDAGFSMS